MIVVVVVDLNSGLLSDLGSEESDSKGAFIDWLLLPLLYNTIGLNSTSELSTLRQQIS